MKISSLIIKALFAFLRLICSFTTKPLLAKRKIYALCVFFMLAGCCEECQLNECHPLSPGCCTIPRTCCCLEKDPKLISKLRRERVQIERMGDKVLLILPSDRFFYRKSPHLNPVHYPTLENVITFLNCYKKIEIKIAAYTDNVGCFEENLALTRDQATNLMAHLWEYGLDARLVYPVGYGSACPIGCNTTERGRSQNRRIEITLTHLPPGVYEE